MSLRKPAQNSLFIICLCGAVVFSYLAMALYFPKLYILATYEDLTGEWLQFWLFALATLFLWRLVLRPSPYRLFFAILALSCFYVTMEEISWGQRVFNLSTPEFFEKHNIQKETNFHNLVTGPVATLTKDSITYSLSAGIAIYGVLYPLAVRRRWRAARPMVKIGIAPPPLFLWPFFAWGAFLELGLFNFNETEIAEMLIAAALAIMGFYYTQFIRHDPNLNILGTCQGADIVPVAVPVCLMFILATLLAVGTTAFSYASEHNRDRIDHRLGNGIEKFAGRYKRYAHWPAAVELYTYIHKQQPNRNSILRKLAQCYQEMGDQEKFQMYTQRALSNDLAEYQKDPDSIALNQSLARTYRQIGLGAKAEHHLSSALQLALAWVDEKPQSAKAAYWLGKTYKLMDKKGKALVQFERAHNLDTLSLKYRKAYYGALKLNGAVKNSNWLHPNN
jgi:hypothetical protein